VLSLEATREQKREFAMQKTDAGQSGAETAVVPRKRKKEGKRKRRRMQLL
jgi:hypothetical protein